MIRKNHDDYTHESLLLQEYNQSELTDNLQILFLLKLVKKIQVFILEEAQRGIGEIDIKNLGGYCESIACIEINGFTNNSC
jgi:hypothetical protein